MSSFTCDPWKGKYQIRETEGKDGKVINKKDEDQQDGRSIYRSCIDQEKNQRILGAKLEKEVQDDG